MKAEERFAYAAARRRAREDDATEPRASAVRYDESKDTFVLSLRDGVVLLIPRTRIPGLTGDNSGAFARVELDDDGEYLCWSELDVDHAVPILVAAVLGIRTVQENARRAGSVKSAAKTMAVRENGRKGGRPRKKTKTA